MYKNVHTRISIIIKWKPQLQSLEFDWNIDITLLWSVMQPQKVTYDDYLKKKREKIKCLYTSIGWDLEGLSSYQITNNAYL